MEDDIIYNVQNIMYRGRDYALYIEEGTKYNIQRERQYTEDDANGSVGDNGRLRRLRPSLRKA